MSESPPSDPQPGITPIALPGEGVGCVILFGGSFDPVTLAHVRMSCEARDVAEAGAWLVFVPAARSPHKAQGPIASDADRVEMLRLALAGLDRCAIWTDEIDRATAGEASYSIDTIERARTVLGEGVRFRLLIGSDQALSFHRWRESRRILEVATPMVMPRDGIARREDLVAAMRGVGAWSGEECERWGSWIVEMTEIDVSATRVRELLEAMNFDDLAGVVDERVIACIRDRNIYAIS